MYNTTLNKNMQYALVSIVNNVGVPPALVDCIVDTGSNDTCFIAKAIDSSLSDKQLKSHRIKRKRGFIGKYEALYYEYSVSQFTISNIDMEKEQYG